MTGTIEKCSCTIQGLLLMSPGGWWIVCQKTQRIDSFTLKFEDCACWGAWSREGVWESPHLRRSRGIQMCSMIYLKFILSRNKKEITVAHWGRLTPPHLWMESVQTLASSGLKKGKKLRVSPQAIKSLCVGFSHWTWLIKNNCCFCSA